MNLINICLQRGSWSFSKSLLNGELSYLFLVTFYFCNFITRQCHITRGAFQDIALGLQKIHASA